MKYIYFSTFQLMEVHMLHLKLIFFMAYKFTNLRNYVVRAVSKILTKGAALSLLDVNISHYLVP